MVSVKSLRGSGEKKQTHPGERRPLNFRRTLRVLGGVDSRILRIYHAVEGRGRGGGEGQGQHRMS